MPAPDEISPKHLMRLIGTPSAPIVVDLRTPEDFAADPRCLPCAVRHNHSDLPGLLRRLNRDPAVILCQAGQKLSQGAVAWLRGEGQAAEFLSGGMLAWVDTPDAPLINTDALPPARDGATRRVTRHRPKVDRIACPWLIKQFIDPQARVLFVAPGEVMAVADRFGATPFDVPGVALAHHGDGCSFDAFLQQFGLRSAALQTMADIIRSADTGRLADHPAAAGLLVLSIGLSRQYRQDSEQLEAGLAFYDALYRWARDGQSETHASSVPGCAS